MYSKPTSVTFFYNPSPFSILGGWMGSLDQKIRRLMVEAVRSGYKVQDFARIFSVCRKTIWKWCKRTRKRGTPIYRDQSKRPHRNHRKVTRNAEIAIVVLREAFNWGTQRIAVNLQSPPPYIITLLESVTGTVWTPVTVSRQTVNDILKKHQLNGSPYKDKRDWKYFRATQPDEMWQIDIRGPIHIENIKKLCSCHPR